MLQIPLGKAIFTPKAYTKGAEYTPLDVVSYNNAVWCCLTQTTTTPSATASAWQLMLAGVPETDIKLPLKNSTTFYFRNNGSLANTGLTEAQAWPATQAGLNKLQAWDAVDNGITLDFAGATVAENVTLHNLTGANSVTVNGGTFLALSLPYTLNSVTLQDITADQIYDSAESTDYTGHCRIKGDVLNQIDKAQGRGFVSGVLEFSGKANIGIYLRTFQAGFTVVGELAFDNPTYSQAAIYGTYGAVTSASSSAKYTGQFTGKKYQFVNGATHNYSGRAVHFDNLPGTLPGTFSPTTATIAARSMGIVGNMGFRPGMPVPMAGTKLYPNCVWPDRSLVLFADWPDLKAEYDAGYIKTTTEANAVASPGNFVLKTDGTGLYLPDTGGLFPRAWRAGTMKYDAGREAGSFQDDAMRPIAGTFGYMGDGVTTHFIVNDLLQKGPFYLAQDNGQGFATATNKKDWMSLGRYVQGMNTANMGDNYNGKTTYPQNFGRPEAIYLGRHATEV